MLLDEVRYVACLPKICKLHRFDIAMLVHVDEDVLRFDVAMHDLLLMAFLKRQYREPENLADILLRQLVSSLVHISL